MSDAGGGSTGMDLIRVGAIRSAIDGLPDDAPAFVTVAGWDLSFSHAWATEVIDPPDAERGSDGHWPTRAGLEMHAGLVELDADERDRVAVTLKREVAELLTAGPDGLPWASSRVASVIHALRVDWPERVEQARSIAVRVEGELADLRRAVESIHTPKAVGSSDPEDPTIICETCRVDFPCETRAFADALDPINAIDEFADQPAPF